MSCVNSVGTSQWLAYSLVVVSPSQIESFQSNELSITQAMKVVREGFTEAKHEAQREVARFSDERLRLHGQVGSGWMSLDREVLCNCCLFPRSCQHSLGPGNEATIIGTMSCNGSLHPSSDFVSSGGVRLSEGGTEPADQRPPAEDERCHEGTCTSISHSVPRLLA